MLTASVETLLEVLGAELLQGELDIMGAGVCIDSRTVEPGCTFFALPGESSDGHEFLRDALDAGARVLVVTREREELAPVFKAAAPRSVAIIRVNDTVEAVQELARWHRDRLHATVIGITGSTGKTTTKDFLTAVLGTSMKVVATEGNRNNELGMPLTVLAAGTDSKALVVEMGMRGLGQIAHLAEIARPDVGLVTNVGASHIELLGTQEAVAAAKGELVKAIPPQGAVFLNGDDAYSESLALESAAPVITYGLGPSCAVRAEAIELDEMSRASFTLVSQHGGCRVSLGVPGKHNVYNALAALAVGLHLGVDAETACAALAETKVSGMRMETVSTASGVTVVNDAYNANPSSMRAAVEALATMAGQRRVAVLGDMAELGSLSELAHFRIGETVASLRLDALVTVGERARRIADGARASGMPDADVRPCSNVQEAIEVLDDLLSAGDVVLVKASRVMGLEAIVEGIVTPRAG